MIMRCLYNEVTRMPIFFNQTALVDLTPSYPRSIACRQLTIPNFPSRFYHKHTYIQNEKINSIQQACIFSNFALLSIPYAQRIYWSLTKKISSSVTMNFQFTHTTKHKSETPSPSSNSFRKMIIMISSTIQPKAMPLSSSRISQLEISQNLKIAEVKQTKKRNYFEQLEIAIIRKRSIQCTKKLITVNLTQKQHTEQEQKV